MTTGTATHTTYEAAARGALLELLQVDAAMGHWYGPGRAARIEPGARLAAVQRLVARHVRSAGEVAFHYLPQRQAPVHTVACLLRTPQPRAPAVALGLGSELRLAQACYKALLEAVGVLQLAKLAMVTAAVDGKRVGVVADESAIFDLDSNVAHYADGGGADILAEKFPNDETVPARDLPPDAAELPPADAVQKLRDAILGQALALYECDLTTVDASQLGLVTARLWSPDLMPLAMPSAPLAAHQRFSVYGGVANQRPHPYP
jgi:thiazole/oxazole-forming peptide maturase SagD family component